MSCPEVMTQTGLVRGFECNGVFKFRGVPYCKPTTGEGRFKPAQAAEGWDGVLDCTKETPIAPQGPSDLEGPMGPLNRRYDEDCLTLEISTPNVNEKLPVAVWFHGGANVSGAGNIDWYDGSELARQGHMVVVGVNFRIGALGFLVHPALNTDNLSIMDQIEALRWVQKNIHAFGGDPDNVTVFGQSAGGNAIVHMMGLEEADGLFQKAILESPSIGRGNHTMQDAITVSESIFKHLGLSATDPQLGEKIRSKSVDEILAATDACFKQDCGAKYAGMIFRPVKDEWHTTQATIDAAVKGAARKKLKIVIGTTADEVHAFTLARDPESEKKSAAMQLARYDWPAQEFAARTQEAGCPTWKYRFMWKAPDSVYDSCHTIELPFVFGTLKAWEKAAMLSGATQEEMLRLQKTMQTLWIKFFKDGEFDEQCWPQFSRKHPVHKIIDNEENGVSEVVFEQA